MQTGAKNKSNRQNLRKVKVWEVQKNLSPNR